MADDLSTDRDASMERALFARELAERETASLGRGESAVVFEHHERFSRAAHEPPFPGDLVHLRCPARSKLHAVRHACLAHGVEKPCDCGRVDVLRLSPHAVEASEADAGHDAERTASPA